MSTIRPILASGVRLGVVPKEQPQEQSEEIPESEDFSEELEGSCELMNDVDSDDGKEDDAEREYDELRFQRIKKRWEDYFDYINNKKE